MAQNPKAVLEHADPQLQEKVGPIWPCAVALDQLQDQARRPLEEELHLLRDKVESLEADKMELRKTCLMMQEQMAAFALQLGAHQKLTGDPFGRMPTGGNVANAGMPGGFAALPIGFPTVPTFPGTPFPAHVPPGLAGSEAGPPGLRAPGPPGPPGLMGAEDAGPLQEEGRDADAAAGAEEPIGRMMAPKARPPQDNVHSDALRMMREYKEQHSDGAAECAWPMQSPGARGGTPARKEPASPLPFHSPSSRGGTPARASPLLASGLNRTPKRTPRLSFNRGTPGMKSPSICASPFVILESGGTVFGFTLRRADDFVLGLDVVHSDLDKGLKVISVKDGGAMSAWNRQCAGGPAAGKAVLPGDRIMKVKSATTPAAMLTECRESTLMKFTVVRGELDEDIDPLCVGS